MKLRRIVSWCGGLLLVGATAFAGCAHLPNYAVPNPGASPTPTPGSTATPPPNCPTQAPNATIVVVISSTITATSVVPYGTINGYVRLNPDNSFGNVATVINAKSTDIIQFVNGESSGPNTILHSAAGFVGAAFPAVPYSFPTSLQTQTGNAITSGGTWSTGRLNPICYSQPMTASPGTYYFGDLDYYNLVNMRDVIVVTP